MLDKKETSLVSQVFSKIENRILSGRMKQGEEVNIEELAESLSVGKATINLVIPLLKKELLIDEKNGKYVVVGVNKVDIEEMYHVKKTIEVLAFGLAAENLTEKELESLKDILDQQVLSMGEKSVEVVSDLDTKFHDLVLNGCGSSTYRSVVSPIHHKLAKFRKASLTEPGRPVKSVNEHREIYNALKERDREKVEKLIKIHIENSCENIIKMIERN